MLGERLVDFEDECYITEATQILGQAICAVLVHLFVLFKHYYEKHSERSSFKKKLTAVVI